MIVIVTVSSKLSAILNLSSGQQLIHEQCVVLEGWPRERRHGKVRVRLPGRSERGNRAAVKEGSAEDEKSLEGGGLIFYMCEYRVKVNAYF